MNMSAYRPTHTVPAPGLQAWSTPDAAQPAAGRLDPGLEVQLVQWWGQWANVQCSNGWTAWVDGAALRPLGGPSRPPPAGAIATRTSATPYALLFGLLAAALLVGGAFLPWFSSSGLDFNAFHIPVDFLWSIDSTLKVDAEPLSVGGLVTVLAVGAGGLALAHRLNALRVVGAIAGVVCIVYGIELSRSLNESPEAPGVFSVLGFGVYVSLVGAVVALVASGRARRSR